jgi:Ala-tRNA(Pro) deacylase
MLRDDRASLLAHLDQLGIAYRLIEHPPVATVEDAQIHWRDLPGLHVKNLFLKDAKDALWLITAPTTRVIDLKAVPALIGSKRLSFASAALLEEVMATKPGSVSPFSILNAPPGRVTLILDQALRGSDAIGMHPLNNEATLTMSYESLLRVLTEAGHTPRLVELNGR